MEHFGPTLAQWLNVGADGTDKYPFFLGCRARTLWPNTTKEPAATPAALLQAAGPSKMGPMPDVWDSCAQPLGTGTRAHLRAGGERTGYIRY